MVADEGMQVVVRPGACLIEGATGYETEDRTMVVQAAGATDRIDSVVLRLNDNIDYRDIDLYVIKGNSSSEPPELTRTGGVYEIGLANLYVSANSSTITTERITDTRLVTERCGYAMPVQKFDTTALFTQLQGQVNENIELIQRAINQTEAAHLQEQIDSISSDIGTASIASISDGTIKGAVVKHEKDVNSLNIKMDGKLANAYNDNANIGKGIKFDKNADGSYFTFRPYRPNNVMQVTKNDTTGLLTIDSDGKITSIEGKVVSTGSLVNELVNISVTVPANSLKTITKSLTKTGYAFLGISGWSVAINAAWFLIPLSVIYQNNQLIVNIGNVGSSQQSGQITIGVTWMKTS